VASDLAETDSEISEDKINASSPEMTECVTEEVCEDAIQLEQVQIEVEW